MSTIIGEYWDEEWLAPLDINSEARLEDYYHPLDTLAMGEPEKTGRAILGRLLPQGGGPGSNAVILLAEEARRQRREAPQPPRPQSASAVSGVRELTQSPSIISSSILEDSHGVSRLRARLEHREPGGPPPATFTEAEARAVRNAAGVSRYPPSRQVFSDQRSQDNWDHASSPSHLAPKTPMTSTAVKHRVALEASFTPIERGLRRQVNVTDEELSELVDSSLALGQAGPGNPDERRVTFDFRAMNNTSTNPQQQRSSRPSQPIAFTSPSARSGTSSDMAVDPDASERGAPEFRDYSRMMFESFRLGCPVDGILGRIESAFIKLGKLFDGEDASVERVLFVSADLLRAATELQVSCINWYATAHQTNTQLMFSSASPKQKWRMVEVAHRRARATLQTALEQAEVLRERDARWERMRASESASAPHYVTSGLFDVD